MDFPKDLDVVVHRVDSQLLARIDSDHNLKSEAILKTKCSVQGCTRYGMRPKGEVAATQTQGSIIDRDTGSKSVFARKMERARAINEKSMITLNDSTNEGVVAGRQVYMLVERQEGRNVGLDGRNGQTRVHSDVISGVENEFCSADR